MSSMVHTLPVLAVLLFAGPLRANLIYTVNYSGVNIHLQGFIETNGALGTFSPDAFDAIAVNYSITASRSDGALPFSFTNGNSTWLSNTDLPSNVSIFVLDSEIGISAPDGDDFNPGNGFLYADAVINGARPNLRLAANQFGFREPAGPGGNRVIFDTVQVPFSLAKAQTIPEGGSTLTLAGLSFAGLAFVGGNLRRRQQ